MSTFSGFIEEIPGISVDRFTMDNLSKSSVFFLSHCHTDHLKGIYDNGEVFFKNLCDKNQYLYCTEISKIILIHICRLTNKTQYQDRIKTIKGFSPVLIELKDVQEYLKVTCIAAGHCPGSVMFLFEHSKKSVLYTGDFRINVDDLSKIKPLHDEVNGKLVPKTFDQIYLDTTFFSDKYEFFPTRQEALDEIIPVVKQWIKTTGNVVSLECSGNYGPEYLFIELSRALKVKVHVKDVSYNSYTFIPELANCITNASYETPLHACMAKQRAGTKNKLFCRSDIDPSSILTIVPSAWIWKKKELEHNISKWDKDNLRFSVCYSAHSSMAELKAFMKYFKAKKLFPNVVPDYKTEEIFIRELNEFHDSLIVDKSSDLGYNVDFSRYKNPKVPRIQLPDFSDNDD